MATDRSSVISDAVADKLRAEGQLYTSGRRQLVELLAALNRPVTTYELLESRTKLTQSSVYRNLAVLEEVGIMQKVASSDDRARFELAEITLRHVGDRCQSPPRQLRALTTGTDACTQRF